MVSNLHMSAEVPLTLWGCETLRPEIAIITEANLQYHTGNFSLHVTQVFPDNFSFWTFLPGSGSSEGFSLLNVLLFMKYNFLKL